MRARARILSQKVVTKVVTRKHQVNACFHAPCHSCHHFSVTTSREITFQCKCDHLSQKRIRNCDRSCDSTRLVVHASACHRNGSEVVTETCDVTAGEHGCSYPVTKSGDRSCDKETAGKRLFQYPLSQLSPLFCDNF